MNKALLLIALLMSILVVTIGCSSNIFELNLTPEDKVETLTKSEYTIRLEKLFKENKYFSLPEDDEEIQQFIEHFSEDQEDAESHSLIFIHEKRIAEGLSSFTCEDPSIAEVHKELFKIYQELFNMDKDKYENNTTKKFEGKSSTEINVTIDLYNRESQCKKDMIDALGMDIDLKNE